MSAKKITTVLLSIFIASVGVGQSISNGVKAKGFFVVRMPGTIPVDENRNPLKLNRDTVFYVYAETTRQNLQWERAWHGGRSFTLIPTAVNETKTSVGVAKSNGKKIAITKAKTGSLFQLELADDQKAGKAPQRIAPNGILLKYRWKNKTYYVSVGALTELESPLYQ